MPNLLLQFNRKILEAEQDPDFPGDELVKLKWKRDVLSRHWPFSKTVEDAEKAEAALKGQKLNIDRNLI